MVRIPVTLADLESGRIKNSVSKLSKHHPDQPAKPKRSSVQQTFAQILGYGGYAELRSEAKKNGTAYTSQSLAIDQIILPISQRISRYWGVSVEKAESIAAALGLVHLDAFRTTARPILSPILREASVRSGEHLASPPVSPKPLLDAMRLATVMPMAQMESLQAALKSSAYITAIHKTLKPSAYAAQIAALQVMLKPSAHIAQIAALQDTLKPSAHMSSIREAMKPLARMAEIQEAMKPLAHMAAIHEAMKPLAHMAAIREAMNPMAHIAEILGVLKSKRR